jgi:hypothetical protein
MIRKSKSVAARRNVKGIRRMREDFLTLTDRMGQGYAGVDPEIATREIAQAVAHARKATKAARSSRRS